MTGNELVVGASVALSEPRGTIVVGRDQVRIRDGTGDTYLPIAGIAWVRPWQE